VLVGLPFAVFKTVETSGGRIIVGCALRNSFAYRRHVGNLGHQQVKAQAGAIQAKNKIPKNVEADQNVEAARIQVHESRTPMGVRSPRGGIHGQSQLGAAGRGIFTPTGESNKECNHRTEETDVRPRPKSMAVPVEPVSKKGLGSNRRRNGFSPRLSMRPRGFGLHQLQFLSGPIFEIKRLLQCWKRNRFQALEIYSCKFTI